MPESRYSPPTDTDPNPTRYVHTLSSAGRILPSASRWNSIEVDFNIIPPASNSEYDSLPSRYSKSFDFDLVVADRRHFKRFLFVSIAIVFVVVALALILHFLPRKHSRSGVSKNYTIAINQALTFFHAQKSGKYPKNSPVKFRGDSGEEDGIVVGNKKHSLEGGFYDSGNNIKFSFPTAYTVTLLSWSAIEYHHKYGDVGELDHVKDIIKWGSDYILRLFLLDQNDDGSVLLFSQVGSGNDTEADNDINCWQRPEDMSYARPVSTCPGTPTDLGGEIVAALSAASLVFRQDNISYSEDLKKAARDLFEVVKNEDSQKQGTYDTVGGCGGEAGDFYKSSGHRDELVWAATWLFFATGNNSYLGFVNDEFDSAKMEEISADEGVFDWNTKLTANAVLLTRLRFFSDPGYPYETTLTKSSTMSDSVMCSYLSKKVNKTPGGLVLLRPGNGAPLQYAVTAAFLSKLYGDYLNLLHKSGGSCGTNKSPFSRDMLTSFSSSQVDYILGDNPMKMSYMVGYGNKYPTHVHHRSGSIPWDRKHYNCGDGKSLWLDSVGPNPNTVVGAMVGGPNDLDRFVDDRAKPEFTEPTISANAGLVAALIALQDPPRDSSYRNGANLGIDQRGIFVNVNFGSSP